MIVTRAGKLGQHLDAAMGIKAARFAPKTPPRGAAKPAAKRAKMPMKTQHSYPPAPKAKR